METQRKTLFFISSSGLVAEGFDWIDGGRSARGIQGCAYRYRSKQRRCDQA
jgi:hypothetical protein